jgi:hypothetical protein
VKNFQTRTLPLIICILVGMALSWVSIYSFWFGVWIFHSVPAARACDAVGSFLLKPGHWIFDRLGDQSSSFMDPVSFTGINGLLLGLAMYAVYLGTWNRRDARRTVNVHERAVAGKF